MASFPFRIPMVRSSGQIAVVVILGVLMMGSARALAASVSGGRTSQHGVVTVYVAKSNLITQLIIQLQTRCTDHKRRDIWPGFRAPFRHPQDADGRLSDSYDIVGRDAATGVRFRQRASFTARVKDNTLTGSAMVAQTLIATGVICKSQRVTFKLHI